MIEPIAFGFNEQTAVNNFFQQQETSPAETIQQRALTEFREMTEALRSHGVHVIIVKDTPQPHTPDSIFPNNWISTHANGYVALYPMHAENRRAERGQDIIGRMKKEGFEVSHIRDYTQSEKTGKYLEGTGSMILDRVNGIAYAALSERTDKELFYKFCQNFEYKPVTFRANQTVAGKRLPIYHTNVMMCVADKYAVVCAEAIDNKEERAIVMKTLLDTGKGIIDITEEQMYRFAGNMLQVENGEGEKLLVMSQSAYDSLREHQIQNLKLYNDIIAVNIPTIEKQGGGSARCMMAEIFLPKEERHINI